MTQTFRLIILKIFIINLLAVIFFPSSSAAQTLNNEPQKILHSESLQSPPIDISYFPQDKISKLPVLYKGRIRPFSVASKLWLYDINMRYKVKGSKFIPFKASFTEDLIWKISLFGPEPWNFTRIFFVKEPTRKVLGLNFNKKRFTLHDLNLAIENVKKPDSEVNLLKRRIVSFKTPDILMLPLANKQAEFGPLSLLENEEDNFTLYSDEHFNEIRTLYLALKESLNKENFVHTQTLSFALVDKLIDSYQDIESKPLITTQTKQLYAPSAFMLELEDILYSSYLLDIIFVSYAIATLLFCLYFIKSKPLFLHIGYSFLIFGFLIQTGLLALRSIILQRPPVSNMLETLIYAPWIAVLVTIITSFFSKNKILPLAASLIGFILFGIIGTSELNQSLENIQPVLDSNYWLTIHVLLIVASYGLFLLSGVMAHISLFSYLKKGIINDGTCKFITQSNYIAVALLIPGTILGGVWAAESWGRFWDWDPKESWAFISCATYLIIIHAHKYHIIRKLGLVIGSIIGFNVVTFTWYGVNYILGQGLHSYGFGSGGQTFYWVFVFFETALISAAYIKKIRLKLN